MSRGFKDLFSGHASSYAKYRVAYPDALFAALAAHSPGRGVAWDAGAGNGQASRGLAAFFAHVVATEPSEAQLAHAEPNPQIEYRCERAEATSLADGSVSLAIAAQAVHWFDHDRYYSEVRRVVRPGGLVAVFCYAVPQIDPALDAELAAFNDETLKSFWAPEIRWVRSGYATLPFPFEPVALSPFASEVTWDLDGLLLNLSTWSAVQKARASGLDVIVNLRERVLPLWGDPASNRVVRWPLGLRAGRVG